MSEELTAKEALQITAEICKENACNTCSFDFLKGSDGTCRNGMAEHADEVVEICKKRKANHASVEIEWAHVCRIIDGTGSFNRCVYKKEIEDDDVLPFDTRDSVAERILKEYCKNHKGIFFALVERICRPKEVR